jgi:hypothetical protein
MSFTKTVSIVAALSSIFGVSVAGRNWRDELFYVKEVKE